MKVLQINSVCGIGSTGRIATDLHGILKEQGHESYIAYGRNNPLNCNDTLKIGNKLDNYSHVAKTRILDQHGFGSKRATRNFINKVKKFDPDIIHLHNIHGYYINVEILFEYLKEVNKPVIWTLHDCWAFTGHCVHFEYDNCDCWRPNGSHHCIQKKSYPSSWLLNNSENNSERKRKAFTGIKNLKIVTPSNWLANLVKQSFLSEYPVKVINNGIDLNVFKPTKSKLRKKYNIEDKFVVLGVANIWNKRKGYDYFIELSKKLSFDEVIILVGLDEKQKKKLPSNIIGITRTNSIHELAEIYSTADVFVNLTLEDNFPTTNLESLASGTPVITFDTGGSGESVNDRCGFIVEKGNLSVIMKKLMQIKEQGKIAYSLRSSEQARIKYNKEDRFKEYVNLYKSVMN